MDLHKIDVEQVAKAIEQDAGVALPGLRDSLAQAKRGDFAAIHTPEQIAARRVGRPSGSVKAMPKASTTIRFDAEVLEALKASGEGWQTRVNDMLRASLRLAGRL